MINPREEDPLHSSALKDGPFVAVYLDWLIILYSIKYVEMKWKFNLIMKVIDSFSLDVATIVKSIVKTLNIAFKICQLVKQIFILIASQGQVQ